MFYAARPRVVHFNDFSKNSPNVNSRASWFTTFLKSSILSTIFIFIISDHHFLWKKYNKRMKKFHEKKTKWNTLGRLMAQPTINNQ